MVKDDSQKAAIDIGVVMKQALDMKASDIHLMPGRPPMLRINGQLSPMPEAPILTAQDTQALAR